MIVIRKDRGEDGQGRQMKILSYGYNRNKGYWVTTVSTGNGILSGVGLEGVVSGGWVTTISGILVSVECSKIRGHCHGSRRIVFELSSPEPRSSPFSFTDGSDLGRKPRENIWEGSTLNLRDRGGLCCFTSKFNGPIGCFK